MWAPGLCPKAAHKFRFGVLAGNDAISSYFQCFSIEDPALLLAYLDDFLATMLDDAALREWVCLVKGIFAALGLRFKEKKCQWEPLQVKRHLGTIIDTRRYRFLVSPDKSNYVAA